MKKILLILAVILASAALYAQDFTTHTVKSGESLWKISQIYGVSLQDILDANKNIDPQTYKIGVGQKIRIPSKSKKTEAKTTPVQQPEQKPAKQVEKDIQTEEDVQEAPKTWWEKIKEAAAKRRQEEQLKKQGLPDKPQEILIEVQKDTIPQTTDSLDFSDILIEQTPQMDSVQIALALPFKSAATPDPASYHFYAGALLAANELGNRGDVAIKFKVMDTTLEQGEDTKEILNSSDIILGPVAPADLRKYAAMLEGDKYAISVLDPAASALVDSIKIIQAPTPWNDQIRNLARWASEDMHRSDSLLVIKEAKQNNARYQAITDKLDADGMPYVILTCDSFEEVPMYFEHFASKNGVTRFIIASEHEEFLSELLVVIANMSSRHQVASYAPARVRAFTSISKEVKEKAGLRMASCYYIDESDPNVQAFKEEYRKLYNVDPDSFAFQGYDLMKYFVAIYQKYKEDWIYYLPDYVGAGLQADFRFKRTDRGFVNTSVRRFKSN